MIEQFFESNTADEITICAAKLDTAAVSTHCHAHTGLPQQPQSAEPPAEAKASDPICLPFAKNLIKASKASSKS